MGLIQVVVGGQFGSEGKGAVGARLGRDYGVGDALVRVAGPNAGHTAYDKAGNKFAFRQLPVAAVTSSEALVVIGAGSEVDPPVLAQEIELAESKGHYIRGRLLVDASATYLTDEHKQAEAGANIVTRIGSTGKGVGAARSARIERVAGTFADAARKYGMSDLVHEDTSSVLNRCLSHHRKVMIEGTQGYGLGFHTRYYPQCTSSDCRAIDFLSMCGVNPWGHELEAWVVLRMYPIRVAGNSGPLAGETSWDDLGLQEELTTVTKKVRRVGGWDRDLARASVAANQGNRGVGTYIALTMADQRWPEVAGFDGRPHEQDFDLPVGLVDFIGDLEFDTGGTRVRLVGTSPTTMVER